MKKRLLSVSLVSAVIVAMSVGCSQKPVLEYDYMRIFVDGQGVLGVTKRGEDPKALVVYFHGLDADESVLLDDEHAPLVNQLVDSGYAVVASNAGGNAFGNRESRRDYERLVGVARDHYRVATVFLLAESMGAVAAVNLMSKSKDPSVKGLAAISPALDLTSAPDSYKSAIAAVYPDGTMASSNPINLPLESLAGKRMRFYASDADAMVPTTQNTDAFDKRFDSVADITVVPCTGGHVDPSCVRPEDIAKWFNQIT